MRNKVSGWRGTGLAVSILLGVSITAGGAGLSPVKWQVTKLDPVLAPTGGVLHVALGVTTGGGPLPAGNLTLIPSFCDGWGRLFWEGVPVACVPGDKANPAILSFAIPYPPLPPGGYIFTGRLRDAAGNEVATVRVPTGCFAPFDFRRDLAWMIFGCDPGSDAHAQALRQVGFNGAGGYSMDYRFPYRWFQDHAVQIPTECYPEAAVLHPEGTAYAGFRNWFLNGFPTDGGLILSLLTEEISAKYEDPAMRAARLRLARANDWMNVPTLSRFNAFFQTDCLSWDEVFRDGFPPLNHPKFGANPIKWTADRDFRDVEAPMMRAEAIRAAQPASVIGPGATHGADFSHFDSMNRRGYNNMTTLDFAMPFIASQKNYGLRPGNRLVNLKAGFVDGAAYFPANEHLYWAALAVNDRLFQIYCPGDGFGALPIKPDGQITDEGAFLQGMIKTIHGLRPVILETRSRIEPAVQCAFGQTADPNLADALAACGVVPNGSGQPSGATRLLFAIGGKPDAAFLEAARNGAGLVLQGNDPNELIDLGIEASADPVPEAKPEKKEGDNNEGNPEALKSMEATAGAAKGATEIDLSPLAKIVPGLAGVKVLGTYGENARVKAGSGLEEIRSGGKLLAIAGPIGEGWLLFLNFRLQNMLLPNGLGGSWGASNLSLLGDASVPDRNAGLVRALLARAGVAEPFRVTNAQGKIHPFVRAFRAEAHAGDQQYLFIVSESAGRLVPNEDPKKASMTLACDKQFSARLRIFDPTVKAIRDLRAGKLLPVQADAQGVTTELSMAAGQGTILSLLREAPSGTISVLLSQGDVAGIEQVHVVLNRLDDKGAPLAAPGHTCWVRFLDPQGREVEALSGWATGAGPHVFSATFALNDPAGEWTVVAEDMTDGTRSQAKLVRQVGSGGLRPARVPAGKLVLGGVRVDAPDPYTVTFEATPYLDGDLIITEIRGVVRTSAALSTPLTVTLRLPAVAGMPEVTVACPAANADTPFAIPLFLSRAQAQALRGQRSQGVDLMLQAPGLPAGSVNWKPNILPLQRAPQRIGSTGGDTLAVKINNFTKTEQRVAITLAPLPGEEGKPWQASATVAPHSSAALERPVPGLPATIDPGLYDLPLEWTAGGVARGQASLSIEEVLEQEWWIQEQHVKMGAPTLADNEAPVLPADARVREQAGWRRVVMQSVLEWEALVSRSGPGRLYAATRVAAPKDGPVQAGYAGPTRPAALWVNGEWQELAMKSGGKSKANGPAVVLCASPVPLRAGLNSVILALDLPAKKQAATSLVLQDPATGKRDRALRIGAR